MDVSGKDGVVKYIFKDCYLYGLSVYSFKKLIDEEFVYDFFWWVYKQVLFKGMIQVFNWLYYEDIFI